MDPLAQQIADHGYPILALAVFLESIGFPIPAAIALLLAGAAGVRGPLHIPRVILTGAAAMVAGDLLMYTLGRYTGWWFLGILCRLSLNPESCIVQSAASFYKRGRSILLVAKFLPGINTMATPLAGSMNMGLGQFLLLDFGGVLLYVSTYAFAGYLFSDFVSAIQKGYATFSSIAGWTLCFAVALWIGRRVVIWYRGRVQEPVHLVLPRDVPEGARILDVRSHGYYDKNAIRIKGSTRLDPNALGYRITGPLQETRAVGAAANGLADCDAVRGKDQVFLYCTCIREATAARVAREMKARGIETRVLMGGLKAWKAAGLPTEPVPADEIVALPRFR